MPRRRNNTAAAASVSVIETITVTDPLPIEDLEEATVEDYKKLNDKLDGVISKIKGRKGKKKL